MDEALSAVIQLQTCWNGRAMKLTANNILTEYGDKLKEESPEGIFKDRAEKEIFSDIKKSLLNLKIQHKIYYNENSLYEDKRIEKLLLDFKAKNLSYEKDNA